MTAIPLSRLRLPCVFLVVLGATACTPQDNGPAPPETGAPAPVPAVVPAEDRGRDQSAEATDPAADDSAFGHVEGGESERAASKRGHESAGEPAPGAEPRSGG